MINRTYAVKPFTDKQINHGGTEGTEESVKNSVDSVTPWLNAVADMSGA
jgi:hypothetical protein